MKQALERFWELVSRHQQQQSNSCECCVQVSRQVGLHMPFVIDLSTRKGSLPREELGKWLEVLVFPCWVWNTAVPQSPKPGLTPFPGQSSGHV